MIFLFVLVFSFLGFLPSIQGVSYNEPLDITIKMSPEDEGNFTGYFDLLIPANQFINGTDHLIVNENFISIHPDYAEYSYLNDSLWISYLAYFTDASYHVQINPFSYIFYGHGNPLYFVTSFKIVKVNDNGEVTAESEIIEFPTLNKFEKQDIVLNYDSVQNNINVIQLTSKRIFIVFLVGLFGFVYLFIHFLHRFLIINFLKVNNRIEKKILIIQLITMIPSSLIMVQALTTYPIFSNVFYLYLLFLGIIIFESLGIYLILPDKTQFHDTLQKNIYSFIPYAVIVISLLLYRFFTVG